MAKLESLQSKVEELEREKAERAQNHAKDLAQLRSQANTSSTKVEEIAKERDDWIEKAKLLEKQLIEADVIADNLRHNKGKEMSRVQKDVEEAKAEVAAKTAEIEKLND